MMIVVLCNCPSGGAEEIADAVVREGLAACGNIIYGIQSVYMWEGELVSAREELLILKAARESWPALRGRIEELHPYEVPEVVQLVVDDVNTAYLEWVRQMSLPKRGIW